MEDGRWRMGVGCAYGYGRKVAVWRMGVGCAYGYGRKVAVWRVADLGDGEGEGGGK